MPLLQWHIKSTTKAQQGLYEYDAVSRLRDSQLAGIEGSDRVRQIENYIVKGVLWQALTVMPVVLLIDEIDKADIEFPNDLLREIDRMEFYVYETRQLVKARATGRWSSSPQQRKGNCPTPSAPLLFPLHPLPDAETMTRIVKVHFPTSRLSCWPPRSKALRRARPARPQKKPSTSGWWTGSACCWPRTPPPRPSRLRTARSACRRWWAPCSRTSGTWSLFENSSSCKGNR